MMALRTKAAAKIAAEVAAPSSRKNIRARFAPLAMGSMYASAWPSLVRSPFAYKSDALLEEQCSSRAVLSYICGALLRCWHDCRPYSTRARSRRADQGDHRYRAPATGLGGRGGAVAQGRRAGDGDGLVGHLPPFPVTG